MRGLAIGLAISAVLWALIIIAVRNASMSDLEFYLGILLAVLFLVIGIDGWRAWRRPAFNPDEFYEQEKSK